LSIQKTISDAEYDRSVISFLQSRHNYESSLIALENVIMQIDQLRQSILDLHLQELEKLGQLKAEVKAGLGNLLNSFNTWEMAYVLKTTVNGTVDFNKFWHVNQNVLAGETVFIIIPEDPGELLGKAQLPVAGSGKVKQGQAVNIRFLNFPDTEYGIVRGIVSSISVVPTSESYTLEVTFPNGLVTTYLNELPFCQEMYAVAEIITEDMRLLERLLMPLKRFVSEQK
jgi:HlyD family secretion protein